MQNFQSCILREAPHWIAIDKPAGWIVERSPFEALTVESSAFAYLQQSTGREKPFLGIVHRLDRLTSGVLVLAKRKSALRMLNQQFAERQVQKTYRAWVAHQPTAEAATLTHWIRRGEKGKKALVSEKPVGKAKKAVLDFQVLGKGKSGWLLEIQLQTGRYHQIRAQMAHVGYPVVGDRFYGSQTPWPAEHGIGLHAWSLGFLPPQEVRPCHLVAEQPQFSL